MVSFRNGPIDQTIPDQEAPQNQIVLGPVHYTTSMKRRHFLPVFIAALMGEIIVTEVFDLNRFIATPLLAIALYFLYSYFGLSREDIGASKISTKAITWSAAIFGLILTFLGLVYFVVPDVLLDERYNQSLAKTLISMVIVLPITTVLLEELAFRGVLLGYLLKSSSKTGALLISSVLFGLWHVMSSRYVQVDSFLFIDYPPQLLISLVIVFVTGAAGWVFSMLRLKTGSILVPIVAHWSFNAFGMLFAWLAWNS